jgi:uncharacterized protein YoxC
MPLSVQLSIVAVAIAFVVLAIVTTRAMLRFDKSIERIVERFSRTSEGVNQALLEVGKVTAEAREVVAAFSEITPLVRRLAGRAERVGDRAVNLSSMVLDEIEKPVRAAVALVRGVRSGTTTLLQRFTRRYNGVAPHQRGNPQ